MTRAPKLIYHVLFWAGIYLLWVLLFRSYSVAVTRTMTVEFCYLIFITADYYAINDFAVPRLLFRRKHALFVVAVIFIVAISAGLRSALALWVSEHVFSPGRPVDYDGLFIRSFINISLWVLLVTIGKMLVDRMRTQQQLDMLEQARVRNELDFLKAQINPHALFNSLNTIYGHIDKHNQVARNILLQFSELLRYQLYDCAADKVSLRKEIGYVENYVAFQRLRKDERLIVHFKVGNIGPELSIAPLMLVVLIENAFKFVSNFPDRPNKICIEIFTNGPVLHANFLNSREPQLPNAGSGKGIGIANLRRRLELLYNKRHELTVNSDYDRYETKLSIDLS